MHDYSLTPLKLGLFNLKRNGFRTAALIFLITAVAFTLFSGSFLLYSLNNGINSLSARMGADLMVVPYGYEKNMQNVLLRGEPSGFYFEKDILEKVRGLDGISQASPQLYLATLSAGCCAYPLQMIGFDPQTDFVIQPWISKPQKKALGSGEIVVGANINALPGQSLMFFGQNFKVAARLGKTGMGFDNSVFMTIATANNLVATADIFKNHPLSGQNEKYSSIVVKTVEGGDVKARQKELAIFRVLGARKSFLRNMLLWEATWLSLSGALIGTLLALIIMWPFSAYISNELSLPYLEPELWEILVIAVLCCSITFLLGPFSSAYSLYQLNKAEICQSIKEDL